MTFRCSMMTAVPKMSHLQVSVGLMKIIAKKSNTSRPEMNLNKSKRIRGKLTKVSTQLWTKIMTNTTWAKTCHTLWYPRTRVLKVINRMSNLQTCKHQIWCRATKEIYLTAIIKITVKITQIPHMQVISTQMLSQKSIWTISIIKPTIHLKVWHSVKWTRVTLTAKRIVKLVIWMPNLTKIVGKITNWHQRPTWINLTIKVRSSPRRLCWSTKR